MMAAWELETFDGNHRAALDLVEAARVERLRGVPTSLLACFSQRALHLDQAADESCGEAVRLLRDELEDQPRSLSLLVMLAEAATLQGDRTGAARHVQSAREVGLDDAVLSADLAIELAQVEMLGGDLDGALDQLEAVLQMPARISAAVLLHSADWTPLREHPRFQLLLETAQST